MQETLNYIKVLNWGYGGFCGSFENIAPLSLSQDFDSSLEQIEKRLAVVDGLNYGALYVEATSANGKANLLKYQSTDDTIEYSLHFMRDRGQLWEALKPDELEIENGESVIKKNPKRLFRGFYDAIDEYRADGVWTGEQYAQYKGALNELERGFDVRLKQFAIAYDFALSDDQDEQQPQPQQIPTELDTPEAKVYLDKAIELGVMDSNYNWRRTKQLLAYFAEQMSNRLNLSNKLDKDGNTTIAWKPFENLFGVSDLKGAKQNWMRINTKFEPTGFEEIDKIFL